ncbi:MAG: hypothetical protein M1839_008320 [Geoglossum umbratile]|nr:MAG: hypothetical protein M1839_008320 [Geoglossum umbratile]
MVELPPKYNKELLTDIALHSNDFLSAQITAEHRTAAELLTRSTTLSEYLNLCHTHLSQAIAVKADLTLSTQGDGVPNIKGKTRPHFMCPWPDFADSQNPAWLGLRETYPLSNPRVFPHLAYLNTCGQDITICLLANESGVAYLQRPSVKNPVSKILHHLHTLPDLRDGFHLDSTGVGFDNHPDALSDRAEEVIENMADLTLRRPLTPVRHTSNPPDPLWPDQICVYTTKVEGEPTNRVAFIIECKPPHKITPDLLRLSLS